MKKTVLAAIAAAIISASVSAEMTGNISGTMGNKSMDDGDWDNVEEQTSIGFVADFKMESWPVSIAMDGFISAADNDSVDDEGDELPEIDASTTDIHLGLRKIWQLKNSKFSSYLGGGVAFITGSQERMINRRRKDENDSATGTWVGGGIYWRPIDSLNLGFDVRYSQADILIFEEDIDAGGLRAGLLVGYHF